MDNVIDFSILPTNVKAVLEQYPDLKSEYSKLLVALEEIGWTCDYDLGTDFYDVHMMKDTMSTERRTITIELNTDFGDFMILDGDMTYNYKWVHQMTDSISEILKRLSSVSFDTTNYLTENFYECVKQLENGLIFNNKLTGNYISSFVVSHPKNLELTMYEHGHIKHNGYTIAFYDYELTSVCIIGTSEWIKCTPEEAIDVVVERILK